MRNIEYQIMMRTRQYKCVEFLNEERGQLHDLENDPDELVNLWDDPVHKERRQLMLKAIHEWFVRSSAQASLRRARTGIDPLTPVRQ